MEKFPEKVILTPVGVVHSPILTPADAPAQGIEANPPIQGRIEIFPQFSAGIVGLERFEFIDVIYYFHLNREARLTEIPRYSSVPRGIFATRSPNRPNHLGLSTVRLLGVEGNFLQVAGIDMVDGTPVLDIKPRLNLPEKFAHFG